jgi:hypothetical protein
MRIYTEVPDPARVPEVLEAGRQLAQAPPCRDRAGRSAWGSLIWLNPHWHERGFDVR